MIRSRNIIAVPPGATIKEQLIDRDMSQKEFSLRMDLSEKHVSRLINGEVQLTPEMALRLETVLSIPADFWSNLEAIYRQKILLAKAENEMDADLELLKKLPYNEMAKRGWLLDTRKPKERVINLRKFFEVVHLGLLQRNALIPLIACRRLFLTEKSDYALLAWTQKAKLEGRNIETQAINLKKLSDAIPKIRAMTKDEPNEFCPLLSALLAEAGVAIVFLPHISGSFLHGATFKDSNKIIVGLTLRGKDADKFWFSLFHELAHIFLDHLNKREGLSETDEENADNWAKDTLIDKKIFEGFTNNNDFSPNAIISFADSNSIDPGIVVGRLQREEYIKYSWHNDLKRKYTFSA